MGILLLLTVISSCAAFNYTKCPFPWELQSEKVKQSFNLTKFVGVYSVLALHDYTQYPVCPSPRCMRSHKVWDQSLHQIKDTFDIVCVGKDYPNSFTFNITDTPGYFRGTWSLVPGILFPDTVVDVQEANGQYEWVTEFQCVERWGHVWFVGINWYSRIQNATQDYIEHILDRSRERGLGMYMDKGEGVRIVDQKDCKYYTIN